ncbi:MAG: hypothetical protein PHO32_01935, partial [Candidatus Cloacimonetes bacterium]|nr:hypothetical protein [Candidatus Cloacimonadota bacterium]
WKLHRIPTENFLNKHKDHCPRLIIQYATEKMDPDKKAHFAKTKVPNSQNRFNKKNKDRHQQHTGADPVRKVTKNDTAPRKKVETHTPKPKALKPNRIKP